MTTLNPKIELVAKENYQAFCDFYNQRSWRSYPSWSQLDEDVQKFWITQSKINYSKLRVIDLETDDSILSE